MLVACEESQRVCIAFREKGHEAYSCDILECSGGHPEWHIQGNVENVLEGMPFCPIEFQTADGTQHSVWEWDMVIAFPPCTDLASSGARWFAEKRADGRQQKSIDFFMLFTCLPTRTKVAIENPVGIMSTLYRKPDQIIQPYEYGHRARKRTCLWLEGLPKLTPTNIVDPGEIMDGGYSVGAHADGRNEHGKWLRFSDPELSILRSKTFPGIAKAMAEQWG